MKLRAFELVKYTKVVILDPTMVIRHNIDELFEVPTPAAMLRGHNHDLQHGARIDATAVGAEYPSQSDAWSERTGINGGLLVVTPDIQDLHHMLEELADERHSATIPGKYLEQDFLSKFFAGKWHHISVEYNFQIHQMYFALTPRFTTSSNRLHCMRHTDIIHTFLHSGAVKPSSKYFNSAYVDLPNAEWMEIYRKGCKGYLTWILQDPHALQLCSDREHVSVDSKGVLRKTRYPSRFRRISDEGLGDVITIPSDLIEATHLISSLAVDEWFTLYSNLGNKLHPHEPAEYIRRIARMTIRPTMQNSLRCHHPQSSHELPGNQNEVTSRTFSEVCLLQIQV